MLIRFFCLFLFAGGSLSAVAADNPPTENQEHRYLYVAAPGVRNYLEYGGHGLLVFDIDNGHKFVKRIKVTQNGGYHQDFVWRVRNCLRHPLSKSGPHSCRDI